MHRLNSLAALACCLTTLVSSQLVARDDGRFANSPLKEWFDRLASRNGLCCAFADGATVQDVDWDTQDGHYRVRIYGQWIVVPDAAVVTEPNRFGPAVVWPYNDRYGNTDRHRFPPPWRAKRGGYSLLGRLVLLTSRNRLQIGNHLGPSVG
jgi:hypothetical protein